MFCFALQIIDSKTCTKTTDEEVLLEKKRYELERRPVQEEVCALGLFDPGTFSLMHVDCINSGALQRSQMLYYIVLTFIVS